MSAALVHEKVWLDKTIYTDAERDYYESLSKVRVTSTLTQSSLANEVAKARQHIKNSLECRAIDDLRKLVISLQARVDILESKGGAKTEAPKMDSVATLAGAPNTELNKKINNIEKENTDLKRAIDDLRKLVISLQARVDILESKGGAKTEAPKSKPAVAAEDSDDGVDLFGSDDEAESAEAARVREERLAAYNAKKSKKPVLIAKSNIILDVKPWDDETDMAALEKAVRDVNTEGLLWGASKLVPLAYGIHKLQISCVVEDDKVSIDWLTEEIEKHEDFVQSVDIAAFNKV